MPRLFVYPYRKGSKSVKSLIKTLGCKSIKLDNSKYRPTRRKIVINYGNSSCPYDCINSPQSVKYASNKRDAFVLMQKEGVSIPEWTTDEAVAQEWYLAGTKVVGRAKLTGHSGEGIIISDDLDYPQAEGGIDVIGMREIAGHLIPLYVKYVKKTEEYRVHVVAGEVIDVVRKMRKKAVPDDKVNWAVRNKAGGFVYGRGGVELPEVALSEAVKAVSALGLDFGAVDIIYNKQEDRYYVLEVNTAPGLEGTTLIKYSDAFQRNYL